MYNVFDYAREYGDKSFDELPFNDVDAVLLINAMYMWVEWVVSRDLQPIDKAMTIAESNKLLLEMFHGEYVGFGLAMNAEVPKGYDLIANTKRFGGIKITGARNEYDIDEHLQYCGITLFIDDEQLMVVYRGTDDSMAGWIEDADILIKQEIPSYKLALDYMHEVADTYPDKKIIVGGHSKGGNVALYTALSCREDVRARFSRVYNNDGPGFADYEIFKTGAYEQTKPVYRHIVPYNSFVGMMLCHDKDYLIVNSSAPIGPMQHSSESWQFKGPELDLKEELGTEGKINERAFELLGENMDMDNLHAIYGMLLAMDEGMSQPGLIGIMRNLPSSVIEAVKAYRQADPSDKDHIRKGLVKFGRIIRETAQEVREESRDKNKK